MFNDYDVDLVVRLLQVAFSDERFASVELSDIRIDPDMPRAATNPAKGGTQWAMCADVQRAFNVCSLAEARAVWAKHVLGLTNAKAGRVLGLNPDTVREMAERGVDRMTRWLNGEAECARDWRQQVREQRAKREARDLMGRACSVTTGRHPRSLAA